MAFNSDPLPGLERLQQKGAEVEVVYQPLQYIWSKVTQLQTRLSGPIFGTLSPNTKPTLGVKDAGTLFFATDFNRTYRWTGSAWADGPDAAARYLIASFSLDPIPQAGWLKCNGSSGLLSTSDGRTTFFTAPNIPTDGNGFSSWIRV